MNTRFVFILAILTLVAPATSVTASSDNPRFTAEIIEILILDHNGDLRNDTVLVTIGLSPSPSINEAIPVLVRLTIFEAVTSFEMAELITLEKGQSGSVSFNATAWTSGLHQLTIDAYDEGLSAPPIRLEPTAFPLSSGLSGPSVNIRAYPVSDAIVQGSSCQVEIDHSDEVSDRYETTTQIILEGTPTRMHIKSGTMSLLDCSDWTPGSYELRFSASNSLGMTAESELMLQIDPAPLPSGVLEVEGNLQDAAFTECRVSVNLTAGQGEVKMIWSTPDGLVQGPSIDCTEWAAGSHLVTVEITDSIGASTLLATNVVRLPPGTLSGDGTGGWVQKEQAALFEPDYKDAKVWTTLIVGSLIALFSPLIILLAVRQRRSKMEEAIEITSPPDSGDCELRADEHGQWWRRHVDGRIDWWDAASELWVPYE